MPQAPDLSIVDNNETVLVGWDFTNLLPTGVSLNAINGTTCSVHSGGSDPSAASRLQGSPHIRGNMVVQFFAPRVAGVTYKLTAVAALSDGEIMDIWILAPCGS